MHGCSSGPSGWSTWIVRSIKRVDDEAESDYADGDALCPRSIIPVGSRLRILRSSMYVIAADPHSIKKLAENVPNG